MSDLAPRMKIFAPLRLRDFRILWTGMAISLLGDGVTLVAIAWQVYLLSDLPSALGTAMMAMSMPQVLLLLFGGMASDRFQKRWLMVGADVIRCLALVTLGILSISTADDDHRAVRQSCSGMSCWVETAESCQKFRRPCLSRAAAV